ncbi:motility-associated protein [Acidithiobacillus thiooxidans]|uniref:motility-associated protein n=1 Tax=Acidithiobacillus thiooxidans TaxID=930 RepID=UPI00026252C0|nr:motility-associated protein [Acidithiobacillus thiooxidans]
MFLIIGYVVALGAIFGGFMLEGGAITALIQPYELLMIGGGAFGAFFCCDISPNLQGRH